MKLRPMIAIYVSITVLLGTVMSFYVPEAEVRAAGVTLSKTSITLRAGESRVLKMKGTYQTVAWSVRSGKSYVKLKKIRRQQVTIVGKQKGKAVVKGEIWYAAKKKKTYTCKVKVKDQQWQCPTCGFLNTDKYCSNCGYAKPTPTPTPIPWAPTPTPTPTMTPTPYVSMSPTPSPTPTPYGWTPTPSPTPTPYGWTPTPVPTPTPYGWTPTPRGWTPTPSPTPTPIPPDLISKRNIVMIINRNYYFNLQLYANSAATEFYNRVSNGTLTAEYAMGPDGEYERCCSLPKTIDSYPSLSYHVQAGEVFLYGSSVLKLSAVDHDTGAPPTRIGKVIPEHVDMLDQALTRIIDGKTTIQFKLYL